MRIPALLIAVLAALAASVRPACAEYPSPATAGFHHCALIYDKNTRDTNDLAPYVTYDKQQAWLFDAFLFLIQNSDRGRGTQYSETQKVDWQYQLDRWFAPGRDLAALDQAIENASKRLGPPATNRRIMLSIPYIHRAVRDFGDIDGKPVDLSSATGRDTAVTWYVSEAIRRFNAAGYRHLELWGFYWMREDIDETDLPVVKAASAIVHDKGYRLLWIPCNGDTGSERWKRAGVDVAIYQPNYAFGTWQNGGRIGRDRIAETARSAKANGLGVEIEAFLIDSKAADRRVFAQYLADGAPGRFGYQAAATAYYLSDDLVERTSRSKDPEVRAPYDMLARYVLGETIADPDPPIVWRWSASAGKRIAEARFPHQRSIAALEVFLDERALEAWGGVVQVSVLRPGAKTWSPGGWAIRARQPAPKQRTGWLAIPVGGSTTGVKVIFSPQTGSSALRVSSLAIDPNDIPHMRTHAGIARPYRFEPYRPAKYGDTGRMLTDGVTQGGYQNGKTVGWLANGASVAVCFDLGRAMPVSEVQAFTQGGGMGAVYWPTPAMALFALDSAPPATPEGRQGLPQGFTLVSGGPIQVDIQRATNDMDGHIQFRPRKPVRARYISLLFRSPTWVMLSEIRVFVNGRNVAPQATYTLRPMPGGGGGGDDEDPSYADDGVRLTDGVVAMDFSPRQLTGWRDDGPRTVTVDLGRKRPVREVTAWTLRGGQNGIWAPKEVSVETSTDGITWQACGSVRPSEVENKLTCDALPCRIALPEPRLARYVRVRVVRGQDWVMLSEVEIH